MKKYYFFVLELGLPNSSYTQVYMVYILICKCPI